MWKKLKESKWVYMALSFLIAVALWGYVYQEADPAVNRTISNIPVTISGESILRSRNLIITDGTDQTCSLDLEARAAIFTRLSKNTITLSVDVSRIVEPGEYELSIDMTPPINVNPTDYTINNSQDELYVTLTVSKLESKEIPVYVEFTGTVAENYQVGTYSVSPSMVSISGQSELVNQVANAKVVLAQKDLNKTYTGELSFVYVGSDGNELPELNVESNVDTVYVLFPIVKSKQLPLEVDIIPGGGATEENVNVTFQKPNGEEISFIDVTGPEEELELYNELTLGEIDLSEVFQTMEYTFPIRLPESFTNESGLTEITALVSLEGLAQREFAVDAITPINVPEGYVANMVTQSKTVTIRGSQEAVDAVFQAQLRIVADLSQAQMAAGRQTVPAQVFLDGNSTVGVVGKYSVTVTLIPEDEAEPEPTEGQES